MRAFIVRPFGTKERINFDEVEAKLIAPALATLGIDGRTTGDKLRADMLEQTKQQQHELLERARVEIDNERLRAIADLRREAVDLALAGASRVIERNLDDQTNRKLVESFLSTVPSTAARRGG